MERDAMIVSKSGGGGVVITVCDTAHLPWHIPH